MFNLFGFFGKQPIKKTTDDITLWSLSDLYEYKAKLENKLAKIDNEIYDRHHNVNNKHYERNKRMMVQNLENE